MDIIRFLSETVSLVPFRYEHLVDIPLAQREVLLDVSVSLYGSSTFDNVGGLLGTGPEDMRVYLNGADLSPAVIFCLRANLDAMDQVVLKQQYKAALDSYLIMGQKLGGAYPGDLVADRAAAQQLLLTNPLSAALDRLGNHQAGWSGNLHIFNFLYRQIDITPIKFSAVLAKHAELTGVKLSLSTLPRIRVAFSAGPCRLYDPNWDPTQPIPRGNITYRFDFLYHNPLDDRVTALETRVTELEGTIVLKLRQILEQVGTNGTIQRDLLRPMVRQLQDQAQRLADAKASLQSNDTQTTVLKQTIDELKRTVDQLK